MKKTITINPGTCSDFTPIVRTALADPDCNRLVFQSGRYDFHPALATEQYLFISNNDEGLKRIAFPILNRDEFEIDGGGAAFIFHGGIIPIFLHDSRNLRIQNFTIDWEVPFHGEGEVISADSHGVDIRIPDGFKYRVEHGQLQFGESPIPFKIRNILEFDSEKRETAFLVRENFGIGNRCRAEETGPQRVLLKAALSEPLPTPGNIIAIVSDRRDFPAIVASDCSDIHMSNTTIHHAGGMGFIAQHCENITLHRVKITPPENGKRMISTTADATHFVNCRGLVKMTDCLFENQMDDPTNVHGIYTQITHIGENGTLDVRLCHPQQYGVKVARVGDRIEIVDHESLATYHEAQVIAVERLNKEFTRLTLDTPPAQTPRTGDAIGNLTGSADVDIRNCHSRGNRARGFLLSTAGKIVIEENTFHTPGPAILIEGDANFWFESGAVRDVVISKNRFENCNYGIWGRAAIQVSPGITEDRQPGSQYHRNIRITDNTFLAFDGRVVRARCVEGLQIEGNQIVTSEDYPQQHMDAPRFDTLHCSSVVVHDNILVPAPEKNTPSTASAIW